MTARVYFKYWDNEKQEFTIDFNKFLLVAHFFGVHNFQDLLTCSLHDYIIGNEDGVSWTDTLPTDHSHSEITFDQILEQLS